MSRVMRVLLAVLMLAGAGVSGLMSATPASAQARATVSQIYVQGNQRIEDETVRSYMRIAVGDPYNSGKVNASLKALFGTGLFADVRIERRATALVVLVKENPLINRVNFEGNSEIKDKDLAKEVSLRARMVFTRSRAQSDVQRIVAVYRRSGRFAARVEPKIIQLSQNRVNLVYEITEGVETRVERINFIGNRKFSDSKLRGVITTAESRWWKILTKSDNYDPDRLNFDKELLRRHYLKNGFADFRVVSAVAELARDGSSFFITFTVEEGPQYKFGPSTVETTVSSLRSANLDSAIVHRAGATYDATKVDKSVENITIESGRAGFAFAKVRPKVNRDEANRTMTITYQVTEGPRAYIERIDIVGNVRTLDKVVRREFRVVEGDAYNKTLIDKGRRRIVALDYFEKVDIKQSQGSAPDKIILTVSVLEKSTGQLSLGAGVSSTETLIGDISISERNLLGRGQFVRLRTSLSFKRQQIDFSFTEPYFLERRISFGVDVFATQTNQQSESSFDSERQGAGFRFGFPISENGALTLRYSFSRDVIRDVDSSASVAVLSAAGTSYTSLLGYTWSYNTLDNPLSPSKGHKFSLSQDIAGLGGTIFYVRSEAKAAVYRNFLYDGLIGSLRVAGGYIEGFNGKKVRVIDRFFKGGESFKGFERAGFGPRDQGSANEDAIGGQLYAISTAELTFPLGLPEEFGVRGAVFSQLGVLFDAPETGPGIKDDASPRGNIGISLLWASPFGPLRVDFAHAYLKKSYDKTQFFNFGVGARF